MGGPFGQWAHQYDVPPRTQSGEGGMVAQSNKYPGSICGLRPIFVLFSHLFPMWGQQTDRPGHSLLRCHAFLPFFNQETRDSFLSYWFSPFQPRCGFDAYSPGQYSLPSFPYSTQTWISLHEVGFPLIVQIMVFVCVTSRAEDSKLGRWWSGKRSTCSDVEDGAIEEGYGSKRGSIPEGRRKVASLMVVVLRTHYDNELGDGCNAPDVTYHNCIPTLAIFGSKLWYSLVVGFCLRFAFFHVVHFISCHHMHRICIRVRLMHLSIFPVVRFVFWHSYVLRRPLLPLLMSGC